MSELTEQLTKMRDEVKWFRNEAARQHHVANNASLVTSRITALIEAEVFERIGEKLAQWADCLS